jgi:hypothetical protein
MNSAPADNPGLAGLGAAAAAAAIRQGGEPVTSGV